ncbi:MAG: hypothetical protein NT105_03805 [Verrucomicrobia bacterium]|nr:hypothetical protein [Verrucomicrobiota bacterium]
MNRFMVMAVAAVLLAAGGAAGAAEKEAPIDWPARAATVKVGMTRAEVEKILPVWNNSRAVRAIVAYPCEPSKPASGWKPLYDYEVYWVTEDWRVSLQYDSPLGLPGIAIGGENDRLRLPVKITKAERSDIVIEPDIPLGVLGVIDTTRVNEPVNPEIEKLLDELATKGVSCFASKFPMFSEEPWCRPDWLDQQWDMYCKLHCYATERLLPYAVRHAAYAKGFEGYTFGDVSLARELDTIKKLPLVITVNGTNYSVMPKNLKP